MALACNIKPLSAFLSTNLNSKVETYDRLGDRIKRSLGYPLVSLEIHTDQLRENIQIAVEAFKQVAMNLAPAVVLPALVMYYKELKMSKKD